MSKENDKTSNASEQQVPMALGAEGAQYHLDSALQHHRSGRLAEAQSGYRQVLELQPGNADALHMLGVLAYQMGKYADAISLIERAAGHLEPNAGVCINLGNALQASGRLDEAVAAFQQAIRIEPGYAMAHNNLGNALRHQGKLADAVTALRKALTLDGRCADAHVNLAMTLQAQGDVSGAMRSYERAVELDPGHESAAHMLAALRGEVTEAAPHDHVARLFDEYAARFDHHLVETLGYSMPGLLRAEIDRLLGQDAHFSRVIDLGCGTGLAGIAFRALSGNLCGVDLSPRMIDQAQVRNVYDDLRVGDVITVLQEDPCRYDLFICADVFPYIGNVEALFSAVSAHSEAGALFAFSTEFSAGRDFVLQPSGRYAHAQGYLRAVADRNGFSVMTMRTENLRKQNEQWIPGDLVVLQYRT